MTFNTDTENDKETKVIVIKTETTEYYISQDEGGYLNIRKKSIMGKDIRAIISEDLELLRII